MLTEEHMAPSVGGRSNPQRTSHILARVIAASYLRLPVACTSQVMGPEEEMIVHKVAFDLPKGRA